jgi:hypothetical protein
VVLVVRFELCYHLVYTLSERKSAPRQVSNPTEAGGQAESAGIPEPSFTLNE